MTSHWFDPDGVICCSCSTKLTRANVVRVDVTDPPAVAPWDRTPTDAARVYVLACVECVINNRVEYE